jgi:hypothetical protein
MLMRSLKISLVILGLGGLVFGYMNCGDAHLIKARQNLSIVSPSTISGKFCAQNNGPSDAPKKIIFIVDMSFSNIADCSMGSPDTTKGTDKPGDRLKKIQEFINSPACDKGNNEYSIIPFSRVIVRDTYPNVTPTPQDPDANQVCKRFVPRNKMVTPQGVVDPQGLLGTLQDLNTSTLTGVQNGSIGCGTGGLPPGEMQTTNYSRALDCMDELIREDTGKVALENPEKLKDQQYFAYFISDGAPTQADTATPEPTSEAPRYANRVKDTVTVAKQMTGGMLLQSVYYGPDGTEFDNADQFLGKMTIAGGTKNTKKVSAISGVNLCDFAAAPDRYVFKQTNFTVVNLTAKMVEGNLFPDSDADGLIDSRETASGRKNRRDNKYNLLDSVCELKNCTNPMVDLSGMACNPTDPTKIQIDPIMGISKCDIEAMGLGTRYTNDDDGLCNPGACPAGGMGDGIPDIIEILKGSLSGTYDSSKQDGGGLTIYDKIQKGRQPYYDETTLRPPIPLELEMKVSPPVEISGGTTCGTAKEYSFSILNNPLVPTVAYTPPIYATTNPPPATPQEANLWHGANENVIMVYFYSTPENGQFIDREIYAAVFKMKFGAHENKVLTKDDFKLVGTVHAQ